MGSFRRAFRKFLAKLKQKLDLDGEKAKYQAGVLPTVRVKAREGRTPTSYRPAPVMGASPYDLVNKRGVQAPVNTVRVNPRTNDVYYEATQRADWQERCPPDEWLYKSLGGPLKESPKVEWRMPSAPPPPRQPPMGFVIA